MYLTLKKLTEEAKCKSWKLKHHTKILNLKSTIYLPESSSIVGKSYKREKNQNLKIWAFSKQKNWDLGVFTIHFELEIFRLEE
jgi:hypothetical protein